MMIFPFLFSTGMILSERWIVPQKLVARVDFVALASYYSMLPITPALLTRTSMPCFLSSSPFTNFSTLSSLETSSCCTSMRPWGYAASSCLREASASSVFLQAMMMCQGAPCLSSPSTMPQPMPLLDPVTMMLLAWLVIQLMRDGSCWDLKQERLNLLVLNKFSYRKPIKNFNFSRLIQEILLECLPLLPDSAKSCILPLRQSVHIKSITLKRMVDTIEQCESELNKELDDLEQDVNKSPYEFSNREKWIRDCDKRINSVKTEIKRYEYQLNELPRQQNNIYGASLKTFQSRFTKAQETFQIKKGKQNGGPITLYDNREQSPQLDQMNMQQLFDRGDNMQNKMIDIIQGMGVSLENGLLMADEINLKLEGQIQQLNRMTEKVKDTGSVLKRAKKHIEYFKKALQCDKCLAALLFLIALALIALIILIVKKANK